MCWALLLATGAIVWFATLVWNLKNAKVERAHHRRAVYKNLEITAAQLNLISGGAKAYSAKGLPR
jgi:hypothetical protein